MNAYYLTWCMKRQLIMENRDNKTAKTYRFKFSDDINNSIQSFAQLHMYESKERLKENYDEFWDSNQEMFMREKERLEAYGFKNDMKLSVFRSMKYYYIKKFKNQSNAQAETNNTGPNQNTRDYIKLNKFIIQYIDMFIIQQLRHDGFKPSKNYDALMADKHFQDLLNDEKPKVFNKYKNFMQEKRNIAVENDGDYDIWWANKIKKTHKNRYFSIKNK